jgi:hypothetical protein
MARIAALYAHQLNQTPSAELATIFDQLVSSIPAAFDIFSYLINKPIELHTDLLAVLTSTFVFDARALLNDGPITISRDYGLVLTTLPLECLQMLYCTSYVMADFEHMMKRVPTMAVTTAARMGDQREATIDEIAIEMIIVVRQLRDAFLVSGFRAVVLMGEDFQSICFDFDYLAVSTAYRCASCSVRCLEPWAFERRCSVCAHACFCSDECASNVNATHVCIGTNNLYSAVLLRTVHITFVPPRILSYSVDEPSPTWFFASYVLSDEDMEMAVSRCVDVVDSIVALELDPGSKAVYPFASFASSSSASSSSSSSNKVVERAEGEGKNARKNRRKRLNKQRRLAEKQ